MSDVIQRDGHLFVPSFKVCLRDDERLATDGLVVEIDLDLCVATAAGKLGDRPAPELAVFHATADGETRKILRRVFVGKIAALERRTWAADRWPVARRVGFVKGRSAGPTEQSLAASAPAAMHRSASRAADADGALPIQHAVGNIVEEARLARRQQLAIAASLFGVGEVELALGARDTDVEQAALLVEHRRIFVRPRQRK